MCNLYSFIIHYKKSIVLLISTTLRRCISLRRGHTRLWACEIEIGRDMTSRCAASFQKLKFNTKHTIYSTFLQHCSFKFVLSIQIRGHAVTYRSAVGHTVSRDANSQARVHQVWTLERSEMRNIFARACVSGLTHSHAYEWKSMERKVQCDRPLSLWLRPLHPARFFTDTPPTRKLGA